MPIKVRCNSRRTLMSMITMNEDGTPVPGDWYLRYAADWRNAFPNDHVTGPGYFYGVSWYTHTPQYDSWWFENQAAKPPARMCAR